MKTKKKKGHWRTLGDIICRKSKKRINVVSVLLFVRLFTVSIFEPGYLFRLNLVLVVYIVLYGCECLLLIGAESFIFQFDIQKAKDQDI